jgi:hypothetical protein
MSKSGGKAVLRSLVPDDAQQAVDRGVRRTLQISFDPLGPLPMGQDKIDDLSGTGALRVKNDP